MNVARARLRCFSLRGQHRDSVARGAALISAFAFGCGAIAEEPSPAHHRKPEAADAWSGLPDASAPPPVPPPPPDCPSSAKVPDLVRLEAVPVPPGVTADFAVRGGNPTLAVAANGDATLVWETTGAIASRTYRGSRWLDIEPVAAGSPYYSGYDVGPKLAARPDGSFVVAYNVYPTSSDRVICTRERVPDGSWLPPATLATTGTGWWQQPDPPLYELVADAFGNVTALVRALEPVSPNASWPTGLLAFRAPAGGHFGDPTVLTTAEPWRFALTADANGAAIAVWDDHGSDWLLRAAAFSGTEWGDARPPALGDGALALASERDRGVTVLGAGRVDGTIRLEAATRRLDGTWTEVTDLGAVPDDIAKATIVADDAGRALATRTSFAFGPGCMHTSALARRDASGAWTSWEEIPGAPPEKTSIATAARSTTGHALIVWQEERSNDGNVCLVDTAYHLSWISASGTWSSAMMLDAGPSLLGATVAFAPTGRALVAWRHDDLVLVRWIDPP